MNKPTFDPFHPNADTSANACDAAEEDNFAAACSWINQAQDGLELQEANEDYKLAAAYVQHRADEAGVVLQRDSKYLPTLWSVA